MLTPKKVKHRKWQRDRRNFKKNFPESRGTSLAFGTFGLKALDYSRVTSNQLESARKVMSKYVKKFGKVWIRIFPDRPITKKPPEVRMGRGKGDPVGYCFEVRPGRMLFEIDGVDKATAMLSLKQAGCKMPVRTVIVSRE
ncbi:MAG: 50S ribosomal protein L16 [bacterium]